MKTKSCKNCVHAGPVRDGQSILWICSGTPEASGQMVRVCHHDPCPKFRRRRAAARRTGAVEQPADKSIRYIPLTQGRVAVVDATDYAWLSLHRWHLVSPRGYCYAGRAHHGKRISMHREIMAPLDGYVVDHIDGDGLNNRRSNLRICTVSQNHQNQAKAPGCSSRYKGVHRDKRTGKYTAQIRPRRKQIHLGAFDSEIEAARAYDRKAIEVFGEYAWLNFPEEHGREPHRRWFTGAE
ncbi:MAG: HNH endonuclease [Phycisphaerales bacterium]|nr:MAG: HNH endonuclease [Phycisphaerales bacterium]